MEGHVDYEFDHIHIMCTDLPTTEQWFIEGVGAELVNRFESLGTPVTKLRVAGVEILMRPARPDENLEIAAIPRYGEEHFGLRVKDLDAAVKVFKQRGIGFDLEPQDFGSGLRIAFMRGPDNLRIELLERKSSTT